MNERIRELAGQAKFMAEEDINKQISYNTELKAFAEKFAELIVRECYETIKKDMELAQIQLLPLDFGMYANGRLHRIIKEHFGVEE
jgi:hypothetical protein